MGTDLTKSVKRTGNIPTKDTDQAGLGLTVAAAWEINPGITLLWTTQSEFKQKVSDFNTTLNERMSTGGGYSEVSNKLKLLDKKIDANMDYLKGLLKTKYGKESQVSYYPQFGIEKVGQAYRYPVDRNKRNKALGLTLEAIVTHGFGADKYGTAFWQPIKTEYDALLKSATEIDGTVSGKVGAKNELKAYLVETQNSLIHVLKGNYPKTWKTVIREWGFQKEKY
jgi:hypothetical protein